MSIRYRDTDEVQEMLLRICEHGREEGWTDDELSRALDHYLLNHAGGFYLETERDRERKRKMN